MTTNDANNIPMLRISRESKIIPIFGVEKTFNTFQNKVIH